MLVVSTKFKTEKFGLSWQSGGYLRLQASIEGGVGLITGWETKISHAESHGQKKKRHKFVSHACNNPVLFFSRQPSTGLLKTQIPSTGWLCRPLDLQVLFQSADGKKRWKWYTCFMIISAWKWHASCSSISHWYEMAPAGWKGWKGGREQAEKYESHGQLFPNNHPLLWDEWMNERMKSKI